MSKTSSSQMHRFLLDLALVIVALTSFFTGEAGTRSRDPTLHQVLAVSMAAGVLVHLAWQWRWITGTTRRFSSRRGRVRLNDVVGAYLLVTFVATYYSGLMISSWVSASRDQELVHLHHVAPKLFVLGVVVHALLHWRWFVDTVRRLGGAKSPGRYLQFAGGAGEARGPESEASQSPREVEGPSTTALRAYTRGEGSSSRPFKKAPWKGWVSSGKVEPS